MMTKMLKKKSRIFIVALLISCIISAIYAKTYSNKGSTPVVFTDLDQGSTLYTCGLMYYDIWRYSDGVSWTSEGKPGDTGRISKETYSFAFDRKIKSIEVVPFDEYNNLHMNVWDEVRPLDYKASVKPHVGQNVKIEKCNVSGKGTKNATVYIEASVTLKANISPLDITKVELGKNVKGLRYYQPIFFKITFGGKILTEYYTIDGHKIPGKGTEENDPKSGNKTFKPDEIPGYKYVGYKFSVDKEPPSGIESIKEGYPPTYNYQDGEIYVYYYFEPEGDIPEPEEPEPGSAMEGGDMDPAAHGIIHADNRDAEAFDVAFGIPSSEKLFVNVFTKEYLYKYKYSQIKGIKTYPVTVSKTYILKWTTSYTSTYTYTDSQGRTQTGTRTNYENHESSSTVTKTYQVEREYSYWMIDALQVYGLDSAQVNNYALPNEGVKIMAKGYTPPTVTTETGGEHIKDPEKLTTSITLPSSTISGGSSCPSVPSEDFSGTAESAVGQVMVANDLLIFNDATLMNNEWKEKKTEDPKVIPQSTEIGRDVLYTKNQLIAPEKLNGVKDSDGTVNYKLIASVGGGNTFADFPIEGINTVTIHTPVVCYAEVHDDKEFNQQVTPDTSRISVILDRGSHITIPTTGQHRDILGYGNRDYKKYTRRKEVKFPFDIYIGEDRSGTYVAANTWIEVPLSYEHMKIYTPIWVDEGDYEVEFRCISINAPYDTSYEHNANLSLENYVAYEKLPVRVIGRLYDFKISDIEDYPNWESIFRKDSTTLEHTETYFNVGKKNQNGKSVEGRENLYNLAVVGHPTKADVGMLPTGYKFKFELTSIGNLFNTYDCLNITPTFWYVSEDGTQRQQVDLYYSENINGKTKHFVKVGSTTDKLNAKYARLGDADRNVLESEITATAYCLGISEETLKNKKIKVGYFNQIVLPAGLRMFSGDTSNLPSNVDPVRCKKGQQHWYGEYYIPNQVYAVPKGYDVYKYASENGLSGKEGFWLKDGYLMVNFKIDTVKDQQFTTPDLSYYNVPLGQMWLIEGALPQKTAANGVTYQIKKGDVILYDLDRKAGEDYETGGIY